MSAPVATRVAYGEALPEMGELFPDLLVLDSDISTAMCTGAFEERFPERHFDFGIAEQDMMAAAAGMAAMGKIPVVNTYAVFAALRACEQMRTFVAYPNLNVKIAVSHGGLAVGWDGVTHQGLEDMSIVRAIPNMTVMAPSSQVELQHMLCTALSLDGPAAIRYPRGMAAVSAPPAELETFELGRGRVLEEGHDVAFIGIGNIIFC